MRTPTWIALLVTLVACTSGDEATEPRFVPLDAEVVREARTGLGWTARDTGRGLSWLDADRHCRALAPGSGAAAWRLPSIEELAALYDPSMEQPCGEARSAGSTRRSNSRAPTSGVQRRRSRRGASTTTSPSAASSPR